MGLFISFEGGEGCGKSTQARALYRQLRRRKLPVLLAKEPGGTPLGRAVRRLLKSDGLRISALAEAFLFIAARAELVQEVIRPALEQGMIVLCDRFADSTLAYQGYGRGLDLTWLSGLNDLATGGLKPDLVILLDLEVGRGLGRKKGHDRFEREPLSFHERIRRGYLELAASEGDRWQVIDASLPPDEVRQAIWRRVREFLDTRGFLPL